MILELRADIRELGQKIETKASREDMHSVRNEVAGIKLVMASRENYIRDTDKNIAELRIDVDSLIGWRNRTIGAAGIIALGFGFIAALLIWAITGR